MKFWGPRVLALVLSLMVPLAADAQQATKVPRVGFLSGVSRSDLQRHVDAFRQGLRELGYVEGQSVAIEYRWAEGKYERFPEFAAELVRLKVGRYRWIGWASDPGCQTSDQDDSYRHGGR